ncbi:LysR family transcriptional regulator [Vibrio sp. Of7-15]|uniref:LysR family transcriptional regulator n=1 Tax=Vibrio sp. Of7-15 TaxID=2724879 RepID=UPI001EF2E03B|nr:LysR family transcriptional regulator [Vibrio sp. Of7-15]
MLLNYLKPMAIFTVVAETGSFTLAGKRLGMPRGKVSEQVTRLEDYLGTKLFIRSTRQVNITAEGSALYQHAKQLLPAAVAGHDEVKSFAQEVKGQIRITTTHDFYEYQLMPILSAFHNKYPKVQFDVLITEERLSIIDESIDIAIRSGDLPDSSLISFPLVKTDIKLYAGANWEHFLPTCPQQLSQFDWVSVAGNDQMDTLTLHNSQGEQESFMLNHQHKANSIASYRHLIEQGFGIGVMATLTADQLVAQGKLIPLLPDWYVSRTQVSLLYPARLNMANRTRLLIEDIKAAMSRQ